MNERVAAKPKFLLIIAGLLALLLAALLLTAYALSSGGGGSASGGRGVPNGGPFTLTDQNGQRRSSDQFNGSYRLVYFGFTHCPDVCPVDLGTIGAALERFEERDAARAARVQPIFITVDPARDTPERLREYLAHFHPRIVGLTGTPQEIDAVKNSYSVFAARGEPTPDGGYLVNHTRIALLYGPAGEPLAILTHEQGPDVLAGELERWVR